MELFEIIESDHNRVLDLLDRLDETSTDMSGTRKDLLRPLEDTLLAHMFAEENYFYPYILDRVSDEDDRELIKTAVNEHKTARNALNELKAVSFKDEEWLDRLETLQELLGDHIEEEESEIFPIATELFEDTTQAGRTFAEMKKQKEEKI